MRMGTEGRDDEQEARHKSDLVSLGSGDAASANAKPGSLIVNETVFSDGFVPDAPLHRHVEMATLAESVKSDTPHHMWLYGKPGTGKTVVLRHVLKQTCGRSADGYIEIDCWEMNTYHRVIDQVARQLDRASRKRTPFEDRTRGFARQDVEDYLRESPLVIVLDQIDQLCLRERNAILYNLAQIGRVSLACVSTGLEALMELDPRVRSRLNPATVHFRPYFSPELTAILKQRAEQGLRLGAWTEDVLRKMAELANGDARLAIRLLREAARLAAGDGGGRIMPRHVRSAWKPLCREALSWRLSRLTEHHRLIYEHTPEQGSIRSDRLRHFYLHTCETRQLSPVAPRTYAKYLQRLIQAGFLAASPAPGRKNLRLIRRCADTP